MPAPKVVVLTGAGISRESGLETFRDPDGIWARNRIEDVATPEAFRRDPGRVQAFYNARRAALADPAIAPNAAHLALVRLEAALAARPAAGFLLVTQNVDDLHERAGSRALVHMHGELRRVRCLACGARARWIADVLPDSACPSCGASRLRPDVVWFGEMPMHMDRIEAALEACTTFVSIGTSGNVHPAAGFVAAVRGRARTIELNLEPSEGSALFDEARQGQATALVPAWVEAFLRAEAP